MPNSACFNPAGNGGCSRAPLTKCPDGTSMRSARPGRAFSRVGILVFSKNTETSKTGDAGARGTDPAPRRDDRLRVPGTRLQVLLQEGPTRVGPVPRKLPEAWYPVPGAVTVCRQSSAPASGYSRPAPPGCSAA